MVEGSDAVVKVRLDQVSLVWSRLSQKLWV